MNEKYLNKIINDDCTNHLSLLDDASIDLLLSDIPYGISIDDWDVLHNNTNSALLGQSPAQLGKSAFKRRGKPINGWSQADRNIGMEYQEWCTKWASLVYPKMKSGSFVFIFGARRTIHRVINSFENVGFLIKDILAWKKPSAHHRAQKLSNIFEKRGLQKKANEWIGWRLGNLAPIYEPIAWFMKPYKIGGTITDNILLNDVGAINLSDCQINDSNPTNILEFGFRSDEIRYHEAQKPEDLMKFLIKLTTKEKQIVLDPFIGSGTTAVAAKSSNRQYIGFEINSDFYKTAISRINEVTNEFKYHYKKESYVQTKLFEKKSSYKSKKLKK